MRKSGLLSPARLLDKVKRRKITWSELWLMETSRLRFTIGATYDVLPSPTNFHVWCGQDPTCHLCAASERLKHILVGCKKSLTQGRGQKKWTNPLSPDSGLLNRNHRLTFPLEIATTNLQLDMVLWSNSNRTIFMIKLTVPWEEAINKPFESKNLRQAKDQGRTGQQKCSQWKWAAGALWPNPLQGCLRK